MNVFVQAFHFAVDNWSLTDSELKRSTLRGLGKALDGLTVEHILLSLKSVGIALIIGLPIGLFLGHIHRFSFIAINISNLGRALPSLGIIAIFLPITGVSENTVIIALVILAAPPILTNTYVAIDQVDSDSVDAAKGLGMRPWQVLAKVELPLALPVIFAGIRTSTVFVVATATLSGFFGGGGLGGVIANPASFGIFGVIGASYVLILLAIVSQLVFLAIEYLVTPAGLREPGKRRFGSRGGQTQGGMSGVLSGSAAGDAALGEDAAESEPGLEPTVSR